MFALTQSCPSRPHTHKHFLITKKKSKQQGREEFRHQENGIGFKCSLGQGNTHKMHTFPNTQATRPSWHLKNNHHHHQRYTLGGCCDYMKSLLATLLYCNIIGKQRESCPVATAEERLHQETPSTSWTSTNPVS